MRRPLLLILVPLLVVGCTAHEKAATQPSEAQTKDIRTRNQGYTLLHDLLADLKDVDKALIFKPKDTEFAKTIADVATMAKISEERITLFSRTDPTLNLKSKSLPAIENETRNSIAGATTRALLTAGSEFELRLLLTQCEATRYAEHLAKSIRAHETHPQRIALLESIAKQSSELNARIIALLALKPQATAKQS